MTQQRQVAASDFDIVVTGLAGLIAALDTLSGKEVAKTSSTVVRKLAEQHGVPMLKAAAPHGRDRGPRSSARRGKPGKRGPLSSNVTVRIIRKRYGEVFALSLGPRAWYRHFVIRGTRPHVIKASDARGARATSAQVRQINRGPRGTPEQQAAALKVGSEFYDQVHHPGAQANPFTKDIGPRLKPAIGAGLSTALIASVTAAVKSKRP